MSDLPNTLVLLAHQSRVDELKQWVKLAGRDLTSYRLLTIRELEDDLTSVCQQEITSVLTGESGGEIQLAGLVPTHSVLAVIFFHDPKAYGDLNFQVFQHVCDQNRLPLASNMGSAIGFIPWLKAPDQLKTLQSSLNEAAS